jgi:hypothetical protein
VAVGAIAASLTLALTVRWVTRASAPTADAARRAPAEASPRPGAADTSDALTAGEQAIVDRALASGEMPRANVVAALGQQSGALMGGAARPADFAPLAPNGVVDSDRPALAWSALEFGGQPVAYRVDLFDANYQRVARSGWRTDTTWTPERPLAAGRTYVWQVTARAGGRDVTIPAPPQPEARFMVTTAEQHADLASLRRRADGSHLALAVLLAHAGVLDEADRELTRASAANPGSSAVKRLRESLRSLR